MIYLDPFLQKTNKGIPRRNRQYILLDRRRNSSKSRTMDDYGSIIVTRATDVTNNPPNTNDTSNEVNDENVNIHLQSAHVQEDE